VDTDDPGRVPKHSYFVLSEVLNSGEVNLPPAAVSYLEGYFMAGYFGPSMQASPRTSYAAHRTTWYPTCQGQAATACAALKGRADTRHGRP